MKFDKVLKNPVFKGITENLYTGRCNITQYQSVTDDIGITRQEEITVFEDIPCRLSYESSKAAEQTDTVSNVSQGIKLFLSPDIPNIKSGSKIIASQNGVTKEYKASGKPAVYTTHQEIELEISKDWT